MDPARADPTRREFVADAAVVVAAGPSMWAALCPQPSPSTPRRMDGLIGKMTATPGWRDARAAMLVEGTRDMSGCLSYVVATDPADADALSVTDGCERAASHGAALALPSVRQAIANGRPLIAGFGPSTVTPPLGWQGLPAAADGTRW